jgi:hypothetical protein
MFQSCYEDSESDTTGMISLRTRSFADSSLCNGTSLMKSVCRISNLDDFLKDDQIAHVSAQKPRANSEDAIQDGDLWNAYLQGDDSILVRGSDSLAYYIRH